MEFIPYGHQDISQDDIDAVVKVLQSDFLTQGPAVPLFEGTVSNYCGAEYSVAVNSATSALHLACLALGVERGDLVWTTPITFVASVNCALYCGAKVDFVDIDPRTYNLSVDCLRSKLEQAEKDGKLPKVVIPVHLCGQPCNMSGIHALGQQYGFKIIEDASHAVGGRYKGEKIGSCRYSDITVFSFHPVKIITTGEGGMALTNDAGLARKMNLLRSHGITRTATEMTQKPEGQWYYQQIDLGYNYRMTDLQAALGNSQMKRLDEFVSKRHSLSKHYNELLADVPVLTPWQHVDSYSGFHLYVIRINTNTARRHVFEVMRNSGIGVNLHYIPVYTHPYHQKFGYNPNDYPEANKYYEEAVSLPMYPGLSIEQQKKVVEVLRESLG